ncbi:plasminogen-binding N-terminal domain-containing protein [Helicobacter sp. 12S02634-8]|uniref:plasminogen-binding N-terminal domain-containing protein n=1 Tax=Helicobacter sp. 12S02634-8 TaxID=1476199 RepID=UPI00117A4B96|nr:plasminogen-binding N-terminal domain-containing protein [Helicobacter sp. 12S02634-8]
MKRFLSLGVLVCLGAVIAMGKEYNEVLKINIDKVDPAQKTLTFPAYDLKVGESGFVITKLTDYNVISAKLQVESIRDGIATAKFGAFDTMAQKYLPTPRLQPHTGDMAVFRETNNRAFLIAPDASTYERIKSQIKDVIFMSSDLMMGYLSDYGGFDPKPKFLRKVCEVYSVGLLYVVGTGSISVLDCQSLAPLDKIAFDTSKVKTTFAPFFSRIQEVKTGSLASAFYSKKSKDYFRYYDTLIQQGPNSK